MSAVFVWVFSLCYGFTVITDFLKTRKDQIPNKMKPAIWVIHTCTLVLFLSLLAKADLMLPTRFLIDYVAPYVNNWLEGVRRL